VDVRLVTAGIVHVRHVHPEQAGADRKPSLIVPDLAREPVEIYRLHEADVQEIRTERLVVRWDEGHGRLSFHAADGRRLLEEAGGEMIPAPQGEWPLYHTKQRWSVNAGEAYYGLGQHEQSVMNYSGHSVLLKQENKDAVTPFVLSSGGYGILWDANSTCTFRAEKPGEITFSAEAAFELEYYVILGPSYDEIIAGYRELTGAAPMFPKWAFGYMQSKERYKTRQELLGTAARFRELGFPIDLMIQDWRYWSEDNDKWSGMIWDPERFPDPDGMIRELHDDLNMKLMAVIWPIVGTETELADELEKVKGFYEGFAWPGSVKLYKPYNKSARDLYWKYANRGLFQRGVDAWWMDGSEPENIERFSGDSDYGPLAASHNAYSLVHTEGIYRHQRAMSEEKRVMILTRSVYAGQQRAAAATWSGDITAGWDTFRKQVAAGINFCMSGLPYWTTDIGGFFLGTYKGNQDPAYRELYTRWFQFGTFCPLFRSHGTHTAREPWHFGEELYPVLKKYTELRYRLMPYIYTLASEVTRNHGTIMRGLPMDFAHDPQVRENGRQFMFGPSILVCPVMEGLLDAISTTIPSGCLIQPDGTPGGLRAEYFTGRNFESKVRTGIDPEINFNWSINEPPGLPRENYSVRWEGLFEVGETGRYEIETISDDGVRLWVDGQLVIDQWQERGETRCSAALDLIAGSCHALKLEYFQGGGHASVQLLWTLPSMRQNKERIEAEVYLPACEGWYDFWTGERFDGGQTIRRETPIDLMPLYVRAGSILPMGPKMQYVGEKPVDPIELRIYPGRDADFVLYEDEGDNYNYESGAFSLIPMHWDDATRTLTIGGRNGFYPGMRTEQTFRVVVVSSGHGEGLIPESQPDAVIAYQGDQMSQFFVAPN
jgi:alpha-D-xyloside xylohydrolase